MAEPVRIGVVGAGSIALRGILPHLTQADVRDRVVVQAVGDPVPGRAQAAAERFGVPHAFERFEDLLARGRRGRGDGRDRYRAGFANELLRQACRRGAGHCGARLPATTRARRCPQGMPDGRRARQAGGRRSWTPHCGV